MSFRAVSWAWDQKITATQKIALLSLANCHNDATEQCNPHLIYVIEKTGLNRKTAVKVLADLEVMGLISRSRQYSKGYWYTLYFDVMIKKPDSKVAKLVLNFQGPKLEPAKVAKLEPAKVAKLELNHYIEPEVELEVEGRQAATRSKPVIKSPPSKDQVSAHMVSKGHPVSACDEWAERFINFYDSKGWLVGKNPMVRWKSSATNWANDNAKKLPRSTTTSFGANGI